MDNTSNNKRGRKVGSETCKRVKVKDLLNHLSEGASVPVAQKFLTTLGIPFEENGMNR